MLHLLASHLAQTQARHASLEGRAYLVVPVVPIVAGVLNGYLVPAEEIAAFVDAWNGIPLPVSHPVNDYGDYISANAPAILEQSIGRFFHARMDGPRLTGELWIDIAKCHRLGGDAAECLRRLEAGEPLEVSTAFYPETVEQAGSYNGIRYEGIHRHLRPDHLALLPHGVGACSWQDGCGAPRTHGAECPCQGGCDITAHARTTARRPTFTGIERTPWSAPTFQVYTHALFPGASMPTSVSACTAAQKQQIAAHTLLGDASASTFAELSVFPCVNPRTGKLNDRALRAVLGGRGAQATIAAEALQSAQAMVRRLLNSEFHANLETNMETDRQGIVRTAINAIVALATGQRATPDDPGLATHLTHDDLRMSLYGLLAKQRNLLYGPDCITDIEEGFVIYRDGERLFRQAYTVGDDQAMTLASDREEVQRNTQYVPVAAPAPVPTPGAVQSYAAQTVADTTQQRQETNGMQTKAELVQALVGCQHTGWTADDAAFLTGLDEPALARLVAEAKTRSPLPTPGEPVVATLDARESAPAVTLEAMQALLRTELDARDQALEGRLATYSQQAVERAERAQLVTHLVAQGFTQDECTGMSLEALRKIIKTVAPATYAGLGFPAFPASGQASDDYPTDAPTWS